MVHTTSNAEQGAMRKVFFGVTMPELLLLLTAGGLQALALAWPWEGGWKGEPLGWLQFAGLVVLAVRLDRSHSPRHAAWQGGWFALAWLSASIWWLFISLHVYGGMPSVLAALAVLLLSMGLASMYAAACYVYRHLARNTLSVPWRALLFACLWLLVELLRGNVFTGFPWGAIAYAHVDGLARHWAPWVGVYGVCALIAFAAMWLGAQRHDRAMKPMGRIQAAWVFGVVGALTYAWVAAPSQYTPTQSRVQATTSLRVSLVQGNVPQDMKFGPGVAQALRDYRDVLMTDKSDLVVLPETAYVVLPQQLPDGYWAPVQERFAKGQQAALIGLPMMREDAATGERRYTNSAMALLPQRDNYRYDKQHLVPFGEFVPLGFRWFIDLMHMPLGDFARGEWDQAPLTFAGQRIAPNICFEDLFGEEIARSFADEAQAPTLMVNLSNIAWFGNTVAIDQHLNISRMRAIEMNRPMLRATNTGATAIIDAQGRVTHRLPSGVKATLTAEVRGVQGSITPYAQWVSAYGLWPLWCLGLVGVLLVTAVGHRARHGHRRFAP